MDKRDGCFQTLIGVALVLGLTGAWILYDIFGMTTTVANTIGLSMDIIGIVILFKFALPQPDGSGSLPQLEGEDDAGEKERLKRLRSHWAIGGLLLVVIGFGLQILAGWLPSDIPPSISPPCEEVLMC